MRIAMVGTGYVGLVSGACFSEFGTEVCCVDLDSDKVARLRHGEMPIYEPGLEALVAKNAAAGRLSFSTDLAGAVGDADAVFIAVGTPSNPDGRGADLTMLFAAARDLAPALRGYTVVVTKSTVPVGTGRKVEAIIRDANPQADFEMVSNPEFLREGAAIDDFMRPDRVIIGAEGARAQAAMQQLYRPLYLMETPVVLTSLETAELTKYASNAFLATKITFINEIADLCESVGADVHDVARGMGLDGRIGRKFLHPGPGYGGSCFPKDTEALVHSAQDAGSPMSIVEAVIAVNSSRKKAMAERVQAHCGGDLTGKTIAVLGLSFKPNTDDMREAPSLEIVPALQAMGARVRAYDPEAMENARALLAGVDFCEDAQTALEGADGLVVVTEWNEFRALDPLRIKELLRAPYVIDLRNVYDPLAMAQAGLTYSSVGRPATRSE